jgi:hypothetical protein
MAHHRHGECKRDGASNLSMDSAIWLFIIDQMVGEHRLMMRMTSRPRSTPPDRSVPGDAVRGMPRCSGATAESDRVL